MNDDPNAMIECTLSDDEIRLILELGIFTDYSPAFRVPKWTAIILANLSLNLAFRRARAVLSRAVTDVEFRAACLATARLQGSIASLTNPTAGE